MIAIQKAEISFKMMMQVRNKIMSAYSGNHADVGLVPTAVAGPGFHSVRQRF
jgi:hypothetical protein